MSLGDRYAARHDTAAMRRAAGVDETAYWDFQPGQRVRVKEGFSGRVTEVQSGPVGGAEIYIVLLDGGVGGGEYSASELAAEDGQVPNSLQSTAVSETSDPGNGLAHLAYSTTASGDDLTEEDSRAAENKVSSKSCPVCGRSDWLAEYREGDFVYVICDECMETTIRVRIPKTGSHLGGAHVASDDYPELAEILVDRPPLAHSTTAALMTYKEAAVPDGKAWDTETVRDPRFDGVGLRQDDDGKWYVYTHRARSDSYDSPKDIPQKDVDFIESTKSVKQAGVYDFEIVPGESEDNAMKRRWSLLEMMREDLDSYLSNKRGGVRWEKHPVLDRWQALAFDKGYITVDANLLGGFEARVVPFDGYGNSLVSDEFYGVDVAKAVQKAEQMAVRLVGWKWFSPSERAKRGLDAQASWEVTDESGNTVYGPVDSSFQAEDAANQIEGETFLSPVTDQQAFQGWGNGQDADVTGQHPVTALREIFGIRFGADGYYRDVGSREEAMDAARDESIGETVPVYVIGHYGDRVATFDDGALVWERHRTSSVTPVHIGGKHDWNPRGNWSYDWCRFRRNERCYYPKELDYEATKEMGYSVWIPVDRGFCARAKWDDQRACEISEPGPNSGEPDALLDATISYEDGGQRGGFPVRASLSGSSLGEDPGMICPACRGEGVGGPFYLPQRDGACGKCDGYGFVDARRLASVLDLPTPTPDEVPILVEAAADPEFGFHVTAAWSDVRAKAKRIRSEGGVRILSALPGSITAEVKGDTAVYQTRLLRQAGRQSVDLWECGCKWASYSWGRSGRWKKYEGRMCSHALALTFEAQSQEWMGGTIQEQPNAPSWSRGVKPEVDQRGRPSAWQIGQPRKASLRMEAMPPIATDPSVDDIVQWYQALARSEEPRTTRLMRDLAGHNLGEMEGLQFRFKGPDSLRRKINDKKSRGGDPRLWINDALRYTVVFHPAVYSAQVQDFLYGVQEAGYKIISEENTWLRGDSYSALHYTLASPAGAPIELQFHTGESFKLKQETLHLLYEEFRDNRTPLSRKQELFDVMTAYWDDVEIPDNVLEYPVEKRYPKPASWNPLNNQSLASAIKEAAETGVWVKFKGQLQKLISLLPGRQVRLQNGTICGADEIVYGKWDPTAGLRFVGANAPRGVPGTDDVTVEMVYSYNPNLFEPEEAQDALVQGLPEQVGDVSINHVEVVAAFDEDIWADDGGSEEELVQEAILRDEPEPALPSTTAIEDEQISTEGSVNSGLEWLMSGPSKGSDDIAAGAREFLAKTSAKKFTPAEQQELINEGEGVLAANFGNLDIRGTHYEALEDLSDDGQLW